MFKKFIDRLKDEKEHDGVAPPPIEPPASAGVPPPPPPSTDPKTPTRDPGSGRSGIAGLAARDRSSSSKSRGVVQNDINDSVYRERSETVDHVDALFGEFGPSISSYILTQSLMAGGLRRVLQKLELRSRGREGADLAQISRWIGENGIERFCRAVGLRFGPGESPPPASQPEEKKAPEPRVAVTPDPPTERIAPAPRPGASRSNEGVAHKQKLSIQPVSLRGDASQPKKDEPTGQNPETSGGAKPFMFSPKKPPEKE